MKILNIIGWIITIITCVISILVDTSLLYSISIIMITLMYLLSLFIHDDVDKEIIDTINFNKR